MSFWTKLQFTIGLGLAAIVLIAGGYVLILQHQLNNTREQLTQEVRLRQEEIRQRQAAERAIVVLAAEHEAASQRKTLAAEAKERTRAVPEANRTPITESMRMTLETADRIGGLK
jgi:hypothetical protein